MEELVATKHHVQPLGSNAYDKLSIHVPDLYKEFSLQRLSKKSVQFQFSEKMFYGIYRSPILPLRLKRVLWVLLRRVHLDQAWFERFKSYWTDILKARPLWSPEDLYFLRNWYRIKFQNIGFDGEVNSHGHLSAWQKSEVLYQLLHLVFRESIGNEYQVCKLFLKYNRKKNFRFLEYGSGTAPVLTTFFEFFGLRSKCEYHMADIQTLAFHYAAYKFRSHSNVQALMLSPENGFRLETKDEYYNAITCLAVFEHLNSPLDTIKRFHKGLQKGGLLFMDYIKGDGGGLDTIQGVQERQAVIDFAQTHFECLYGRLDKDSSMGLTVLRKK